MTTDHVLTPPKDQGWVSMEPTKHFFVDMLVRDVALLPAVVDLVDNAIDAARRERPSGDYTGLIVSISADAEHFEVSDNCGGMALDTARNYAFRFGREPGHVPGKHSIGQFGVGMKRTLFKLGEHFIVQAATRTDSFTLDVSVPRWLDDGRWAFPLGKYQEGENRSADETFTTVLVKSLHPDVARDLAAPDWLKHLGQELTHKHRRALQAGLVMLVGTQRLLAEPLELSVSDALRPARVQVTYDAGASTVHADLLCGLSAPNEDLSGWYVFCNGRLVVGPDTTSSTGWGTTPSGSVRLPKWHKQFERFRGFVILESDDPAAIPWNTTKTDLDRDSPVWRDCLVRMNGLARGVIDYLNTFDRALHNADNIEKDDDREAVEGALSAIAAASSQDVVRLLSSIEGDQALAVPVIDVRMLPEAQGRISYKRPVSEIEAVKHRLGASTNLQVGNGTFEYYVAAEVD